MPSSIAREACELPPKLPPNPGSRGPRDETGPILP
jgi:hypothetical protein